MHVSALTIIQFVVVIAYLELFILTLYKNPRERLNQVVALFSLCFLWWGLDMILLWMPDTPQATAVLADKIGSFGWATFSSIFLWLVMILTQEQKILKKKAFYVIIFGLPLVMIAREWAVPFSICVKRGTYGWNFAWSDSIWAYLFLAYYAVFFIAGFWLLYRCYRRTEDRQRKTQLLIVLISSLVSTAIGTVTDIALPLFTNEPMPVFSNIATIFWVGGIFYAIVRYKLMSINFERASQNIVDHMANSLLLLDKGGKITDANRQATKFLKRTKDEMLNREISAYFEPGRQGEITEMIRSRTELENLDTQVLPKDGAPIPILFSCSRVTSEAGEFLGWVCMASDISRQKQDEAVLTEKNLELRKSITEMERFQKLVVNRELKMKELKQHIQELEQKPKTSV
jgi:PAS domain S-box-containing protein